MQQTIYRQESTALIFSGFLFLLNTFILMPSQVQGQVIIKERMELSSESQQTIVDDDNEDEVSAAYDPVLYELGDSKYLVLKTGWLKLYFGKAQTYGDDYRTLYLTRKGFSQQSDTTVDITNYAIDPITFRNPSDPECPQTHSWFQQEVSYGRAVQHDSFVNPDVPDSSYGTSGGIEVGKGGVLGFLRFEMEGATTNAIMESAALTLNPSDSDGGPNGYPEFEVTRSGSNWTESTLTWNNRPSAFGESMTFTNDDTIKVGGLTGAFQKDIKDIISLGPEISLQIDGGATLTFQSKEYSIFRPLTIPHLSFKFLNQASAPGMSERRIDAGYFQAGDTLEVNWQGIGNFFEPGTQSNLGRLVFEQSSSGCVYEQLGLQVDMEEDTTRRPYLQVEVRPDTTIVAPGDLTGITPLLKFDNGKVAEFDSPFQPFSVELQQGAEYGTLVTDLEDDEPGDTGDLHYLIGPDFGFQADSSAVTPSTVRVRVATRVFGPPVIISEAPGGRTPKPVQTGRAKGFGNKQSSQVQTSVLQDDKLEPFPLPGIYIEGTADITIDDEGGETIMLGETKYYYATEDPDDPGKLLIKATGTKFNEEPTAPEDAIANAFGDDPVEVATGGKSGVYWEKKWPKISSNGNLTMNTLSDKLIRVVGRYWEKDKTYKVKLKASSGNKSGELEIEVVKPEKLGEDDNQRIYTDAFENEHNLDSLAIAFGGRTGMPPHFLKGIISQESSRRASYRYEPDLDYTYQMDDQPWKIRARNSMQQNPYWIVDATNEGNPTIPTNHTIYNDRGNVISYPGFDGTMYDLFNQKREAEIQDRGEIFTKLEDLRDEIKDQLILNGNPDPSEIENLAQEQLNKWLQDTYRGGLDNIAKQTRIIASYGPM